MNKPHPLLQISIHGTDGSLSTFTLHDPASIQRILNELQHSHFFTRERIIIARHSSLIDLVVSKIARIDLAGEGLAGWNPKSPPDGPEFIEISEHEFLSELETRELDQVERSQRQLATGERFARLVDVHLPSGQHIYLKLHGVTALAAERLQKIHYFLTLPGLWFRSPGAGFGIVHLSAAIKFTAYPGPPEVPAEAWLANK